MSELVVLAFEGSGPASRPGSRRFLNLLLLLLLATVVIAVGLVSLGFFDPQPAGELAHEFEAGVYTVSPGEERLEWFPLEEGLPDDFALQMLNVIDDGEPGIEVGVAAGDSAAALVLALSPNGYVAIWEETLNGKRYLLPWQSWPHVRPGENEIWLQREGKRWQARINRELLWEGSWEGRGGLAGIYLGRGEGSEPATVDIPVVRVYR